MRKRLEGRTLLLIAPGKSSYEERGRIAAFSTAQNVVTVSVNFAYDCIEPDLIFVSNMRRFQAVPPDKRNKCIVTSNIQADGVYRSVPYQELINDTEAVRDNAALMAVRFFMLNGVSDFYLAGVDGYSHDIDDNYGRESMTYTMKIAVFDAINAGMEKVLKDYREQVSIQFLTRPRFVVF